MGAADAATSPAQHPTPKPIDALFGALKQATSPEEAKPIEDEIAVVFRQSGSSTVDLLMTRATAALASGDSQTARRLLDAVTEVAPNYAEGWHERAQLQVGANDQEGAMLSLQHAITINPREFRAMAELADMLEEYGDKPGALKLYRKVLALDPHLEGVDRHVKTLERDVEGQGI
jgi:Flp pilus assembly protein TadD